MRPITFGTFTPRRLVLPVAVVAWCAIIFYASSRPHLLITTQHTLDLVLRKLAHMAEYGVLTILLSMTFRQEGLAPARARVAGIAVAIAYAVTDEWHQSFVAGRVGSPIDVGIDSVGVLVAALIVLHRIDSRFRSTP